MAIKYRNLTSNDGHDYKTIRLELLRSNPTNFGSSFEEESQFDDDRWIQRLNNPNATTIGAFDGNKIIGICVVIKNPRKKMKHRATLNSMYVSSDYRRSGVSRGLLNEVYMILSKEDIEVLNLSVVSTNLPAIVLYLKEGFVEEGMEKKAIKIDDKYYDLQLMSKQL